LLTVVFYLSVVILILVWPHFEFVKRWEAQRQQEIVKLQQEELRRQRFVFVQPRVDIQAPKPPPRADLSDLDRKARTVERAPKPTNNMPFSRGNTFERVEGAPPAPEARANEAPQPQPKADSQAMALPDSPTATQPKGVELPQPRGPSAGVLADAIRNVQKYAPRDSYSNPQGGGDQEFGPAIQFDTKGVEFGPWLRRFIAQIRRNWFIPESAMFQKGHVVITFYVGKDGRITELKVLRPSDVGAFNNSAFNALAASNPTQPLPPEYPDDRAFFTVTFYFNENPGQ
jgi:TonB family protein